MDSEYVIGPDGELYHWGIKGMRWGQRRYQNKDGSLTPAGKKRYKSTEEELKAREKVIKNKERVRAMQAKQAAKKAELDAREAALNDGPKKKTLKETLQERKEAKAAKKAAKAGAIDTSKQKSIKDMTDDELRAYTSRMQLEKSYLDAQRNLDAVTPKKVNKGKEFVENLMRDVVAPTASKVGKEWLEKVAMEKLGLNKKEVDTLGELEKTWKKLDYEQKIDKLRNPDKYLSEEDKTKRYDRERKIEKDKAEKAKQEKAAAEKARKEKEAADEAARVANEEKSREYYDSQYSSKGGEKTNIGTNTEKVFEGTVEGKGTSGTSSNSSSGRTTPKSTVDAEWWSNVSDTPVTSLTTTHNSYFTAKSYVSGYLDSPVSDLPSANSSGYLPAPRDDD